MCGISVLLGEVYVFDAAIIHRALHESTHLNVDEAAKAPELLYIISLSLPGADTLPEPILVKLEPSPYKLSK